MPDTTWEKVIDDMVKNNIKIKWLVIFNTEIDEQGRPDIRFGKQVTTVLTEKWDYYIRLDISHIGREVLFKNLQLRVKSAPFVNFFRDWDYSDYASRVSLNLENFGDGAFHQWRIPMRVTQSFKAEHKKNFIQVGTYGEVKPEGHHWYNFKFW